MNSSPLLVVVVLAVLVLAVYPSTSSSPSNNGTGSPYTPTTPWSTSIPWPTSTAIVAGSTTTPPTSSQWDDRFTEYTADNGGCHLQSSITAVLFCLLICFTSYC